MRNFFHGWRPKVGLVTLVMACLLMAGWMRSFSHLDRLDGFFCALMTHGYIVSTNGNLNVIRRFPFPPDSALNSLHLKKLFSWHTHLADPYWPVLLGRPTYTPEIPHGGLPDCWSEFEVRWRFDFSGFHFGEGKHFSWAEWKVELWVIPYWAIIIPLTVLSARLLLSKPRTETMKKPFKI